MPDEPSPKHGWAGIPPKRSLREELVRRARSMRHEPSPAENRLWQHIRRRQLLGYKFRRQHPIHCYIVDFYCAEARLVVEVDGRSHDDTGEYDAERTEVLEDIGLRVIRVTNWEVKHNLEGVLCFIVEALQGDVEDEE